MHIPDGFLDVKTMAGTGVFSLGGLAWSFRRAREIVRDRTVPLMGLLAAFVFAAQMLNFPVAAGTSGHLIGAALCAVILGPWLAAVILAIVLVVQCLIFQDGGLLSLGANIFNMSFVAAFSAYWVFKFAERVLGRRRALFWGTAFAAWFSVVAASAVCSAELALSGTVPFWISLKAMVGVHALIGIGEAVITVLVIGFINKVRPDVVGTENRK